MYTYYCLILSFPLLAVSPQEFFQFPANLTLYPPLILGDKQHSICCTADVTNHRNSTPKIVITITPNNDPEKETRITAKSRSQHNKCNYINVEAEHHLTNATCNITFEDGSQTKLYFIEQMRVVKVWTPVVLGPHTVTEFESFTFTCTGELTFDKEDDFTLTWYVDGEKDATHTNVKTYFLEFLDADHQRLPKYKVEGTLTVRVPGVLEGESVRLFEMKCQIEHVLLPDWKRVDAGVMRVTVQRASDANKAEGLGDEGTETNSSTNGTTYEEEATSGLSSTNLALVTFFSIVGIVVLVAAIIAVVNKVCIRESSQEPDVDTEEDMTGKHPPVIRVQTPSIGTRSTASSTSEESGSSYSSGGSDQKMAASVSPENTRSESAKQSAAQSVLPSEGMPLKEADVHITTA